MQRSTGRALGARLFKPRRVARAHSGTESYAYVVVDDGRVSGNVQFPVRNLNAVLGIDLPEDEAGLVAGIERHRDLLTEYAADHFSVGGWDLRFDGSRVLVRKAGSYVILEYTASGHPTPLPRRFTVGYDGIMHADHHHHALVMVRTSAGFGPLQTLHEERLEFSPHHTEHEVSVPDDSVVNDLAGAVTCVGAGAKEYVRRARKRLKQAR